MIRRQRQALCAFMNAVFTPRCPAHRHLPTMPMAVVPPLPPRRAGPAARRASDPFSLRRRFLPDAVGLAAHRADARSDPGTDPRKSLCPPGQGAFQPLAASLRGAAGLRHGPARGAPGRGQRRGLRRRDHRRHARPGLVAGQAPGHSAEEPARSSRRARPSAAVRPSRRWAASSAWRRARSPSPWARCSSSTRWPCTFFRCWGMRCT